MVAYLLCLSVNHAIGKVTQAWIKDDMSADMTKYKNIFESFKKEARSIVDEMSTHPFKNKLLGDEKRYFPRKSLYILL